MELKPKEPPTKPIVGWRDSQDIHEAISEIMEETGACISDVKKALIRIGIKGYKAAGNKQSKAVAVKKQDVSAKKASSNFVKPSFMELCYYFEDRGLTEERAEYQAGAFIDYYNSNGWKVSKNPMKDWKAAVRNWIRRS